MWLMYGAPPLPQQKAPGPSLRISLILMIGGAILAIPTLVIGLLPIIDALDSTEYPVPNTISQKLGTGTYVVYERTGSSSLGSGFGEAIVTIDPEDVRVTGPNGVVRTYRADIDDVLAQADSSSEYTGAVRFKAESEGQYTIRIDNVPPTTVVIAHPFVDTFTRAFVWFAIAGIGGIAFIVGAVLLIVGSVRRSRYRTAMTFASPQFDATSQYPAGWHPDPGGSGRQRYWDGTRWTEHLH
jgi:hypothetical protein